MPPQRREKLQAAGCGERVWSLVVIPRWWVTGERLSGWYWGFIISRRVLCIFATMFSTCHCRTWRGRMCKVPVYERRRRGLAPVGDQAHSTVCGDFACVCKVESHLIWFIYSAAAAIQRFNPADCSFWLRERSWHTGARCGVCSVLVQAASLVCRGCAVQPKPSYPTGRGRGAGLSPWHPNQHCWVPREKRAGTELEKGLP